MKNPLLRMIERDEFDNAKLIEYAVQFAQSSNEFYFFVEDILMEEDAEGRDEENNIF